MKEVTHKSVMCWAVSQAGTDNNQVPLPKSLAHILHPEAGKEVPQLSVARTRGRGQAALGLDISGVTD